MPIVPRRHTTSLGIGPVRALTPTRCTSLAGAPC